MKKLFFSALGIVSLGLLFSFSKMEDEIPVLVMNPADIHYTPDGDIDETPVKAEVINTTGKYALAADGGGDGTGVICPGTGYPCSFIVMYHGDPIIFVGSKGKGKPNYQP